MLLKSWKGFSLKWSESQLRRYEIFTFSSVPSVEIVQSASNQFVWLKVFRLNCQGYESSHQIAAAFSEIKNFQNLGLNYMFLMFKILSNFCEKIIKPWKIFLSILWDVCQLIHISPHFYLQFETFSCSKICHWRLMKLTIKIQPNMRVLN